MSITNQIADWKKAIRTVETKYYEVIHSLHRYLLTEALSITIK
jgi:hypothetical protein